MSRFIPKSRECWLVTAILIGVAIGYGLSQTNVVESPPLFATASHGTDGLTVVTGTVSRELEIVVVLEHATGELTGYVPSPTTGKFFAKFSYPNVGKDLGVNKTKKPKYAMVTGRAQFRPTGGGTVGECVIYIAEENSGKIISYGIPLKNGWLSSNAKTQALFKKLDIAPIGSGKRRGRSR